MFIPWWKKDDWATILDGAWIGCSSLDGTEKLDDGATVSDGASIKCLLHDGKEFFDDEVTILDGVWIRYSFLGDGEVLDDLGVHSYDASIGAMDSWSSLGKE